MTIHFPHLLFSILILSIQSFAQASYKSSPGNSQSNQLYLDQRLDSLFSYYNSNTPGIAVTVLQKGKVLAKKAYGMSSLEFGVPFSHQTIVRMEYAEGREFLAIAAVLMEQEGLLSLQDPVRKYFPGLPAWSEPVTLRHLIHHSSGFVDEWAAFLLTQSSMGNRLDVSQFLNLLYQQPAPGFEPGKGYMYCNSDYGLLRLILEQAAGENLPAWMKRKIFDPLGMHSTRLHDDKDEVIRGFAHEYKSKGRGRYVRWTSDKTSPGGNYFIATSADDLEKWALLHDDPGSFASKALRYLKKDANLMPGKGRNYTFGIKEETDEVPALILHQGVNNRPWLSSSSDSEYALIILGNSPGDYVQYHHTIMNWLMGLDKPVFQNKRFERKPIAYNTADLHALAGRYFDDDTLGFESFTRDRKNLLQLVMHRDSLKWQLDKHTLIPLEQIAPYVFKDPDYDIYLEFLLPKSKADQIHLNVHVPAQNKMFQHVRDTSTLWKPSDKELHEFTGKYYSPHLDFYWTLVMDEGGNLLIKRPTMPDEELKPETKDLFTFGIEKYAHAKPFEAFIHFHRDRSGQITHFTVSHTRLMHHRFDKKS
jgi:CubicO group peptidase (beta-lactamase class C family)